MGPLIDLLPLSYTDAVVAVGAALLGIAAGVLGAFTVLRQRALVGDALAHAALPGVCLAFIVSGARDASTLLIGAACAGIVGAVMVVGIEQTSRIRADAAIGVVLATFFSFGIVLLTAIAKSDDAGQAGLERYLFGQAAGLVERDVDVMAVLALGAIAVVALAFRALKVTLFDPAFAAAAGLPVRLIELAMTALLVVAVVIGLRTVGAILMVAMIVVPTVAARQLTGRLSTLLPVAALVGAGVGVAGSLLSAAAQVPTGPVIVLLGVAVALACILAAPGRGVLWRLWRRRWERRQVLLEGVLMDLAAALSAGPAPTEEQLELSGGRPHRELRRGLGLLERGGLAVRSPGGRFSLTARGLKTAGELAERRKLWSAWLEHGAAITLPDAREPDPSDLRRSLGDDVAERLIALSGSRA